MASFLGRQAPTPAWTIDEASTFAALKEFKLLQLLSTDRKALGAARRLGFVSAGQPHTHPQPHTPAAAAGSAAAPPAAAPAAASSRSQPSPRPARSTRAQAAARPQPQPHGLLQPCQSQMYNKTFISDGIAVRRTVRRAGSRRCLAIQCRLAGTLSTYW